MRESYIIESYRTYKDVTEKDTLQEALSTAVDRLLEGAINVGIVLPSGDTLTVFLTKSSKR